MRIKKVTIQNFMPFKGEQSIEFPDHGSRNIILIFGNNMRGKTSILNAIRWCLYGVALARSARRITKVDLINSEAARENNYLMSVSLNFEHENKKYKLSRKIEFLDETRKPHLDLDFDETVGLTIDGQVIPADQIEHEISLIMSEAVSRFFLFDGELLQEYEELLDASSKHSREIIESIEAILGVPALVNARSDIQFELDRAIDTQATFAMNDDRAKKIGEDTARLNKKLRSVEEDIEENKSTKDEQNKKIEELRIYLESTEHALARKNDLSKLENEESRINNDIDRLKENTRKLLKSAWIDMLAKSVVSENNLLKHKKDSFRKLKDDYTGLAYQIDVAEKSLSESKTCKTCGQKLPEAVALSLEEKIRELKFKKSKISFCPSELKRIEELVEGLSEIQGMSEGESSRIVDNDSSISAYQVRLHSFREEMKKIREEIQDFDTAEIQNKRLQKTHFEKLFWETGLKIDELNKQVSEYKSEIEKNSKRISKISDDHGDLDRSNARVKVLTRLHSIFDGGVTELRSQLRDRVESNSTKTFQSLTTEKTYSGLKINDSYGLSIMDQNSHEVRERSAGAEQVVALSLIDGLNKTSGKNAPVIMDTPFGRLDLHHRKNIMEFLPEMSDQVVLLVHEGELRNEDMKIFASRIGARFEITRISAVHSKIVKVI